MDPNDLLDEQLKFHGTDGLDDVDDDTEIQLASFTNWEPVIDALQSVRFDHAGKRRAVDEILDILGDEDEPMLTVDEIRLCLEAMDIHADNLSESVEMYQRSLASALVQGPERQQQIAERREERRTDPIRAAKYVIDAHLEGIGHYPRSSIKYAEQIADALDEEGLLVDELTR